MARYIVAEGIDDIAARNRSSTDSFMRGAYQGATFEWGDELIAAANRLFGKDYAETLQSARDRSKELKDANPGTYTAGKFAGAVAVPGIGVGAMAARGGMTLANVARTGTVVGGASGVAEGIGEYESKGRGLADDLAGGATKAALSGAVGALAGGIGAPILYSLGSGLRAGGRYLYDVSRGDEIAPALRKTEQALRRQNTDPRAMMDELLTTAPPSVRGTDPDTLSYILRGLQQGRTATEISQELATRGVTLTPSQVGARAAGFDRGNPVPRDMLKLSEEVGGGEAGRTGLTSLMQGVTTMPGRGREIALRNMGQTMEAAPDRMRQRLSGELGDLDFRRGLREREAARTANANRLYGSARANDPNDVQIQPILDGWSLYGRGIGGQTGAYVNHAVQIMSGLRPGSTSLPINNLDRYQQARRTLDRLLTEMRSGANPDQVAVGLVTRMRNELNDAVHAANPRFAQADAQFADDMARETAMRMGRDFDLRSGQNADDLLQEMRRLEARNPQVAEELRDMFSQGMLRRLADNIENQGGIPASMVQPLTGGVRPAPQMAMREALGAPLPGAPVARRSNQATGAVAGQPVPYQPGRQTAQQATNILDEEARLRKIFTDVWGNSNTANKLAAQDDMRELPRIAAQMTTGGLAGARDAVVNRLVNAMTERNAEQVARIVTETDPRTMYLALHEIQRMRPMIYRGEAAMGAPAVGLSAAAGQQLTGN